MPLKDAARQLGVSPERVRQMIHSGELAGIRVGNVWADIYVPAAGLAQISDAVPIVENPFGPVRLRVVADHIWPTIHHGPLAPRELSASTSSNQWTLGIASPANTGSTMAERPTIVFPPLVGRQLASWQALMELDPDPQNHGLGHPERASGSSGCGTVASDVRQRTPPMPSRARPHR